MKRLEIASYFENLLMKQLPKYRCYCFCELEGTSVLVYVHHDAKLKLDEEDDPIVDPLCSFDFMANIDLTVETEEAIVKQLRKIWRRAAKLNIQKAIEEAGL